MLGRVRDAMLSRGGAALGDKTMVDMLDAVSTAITGVDTAAAATEAARKSATATLDAFRRQPNRIGRARMFGDKSIGLDDPGMLAFVRLLDGVCAIAAS